MRVDQLATEFLYWGKLIRPESYDEFSHYFSTMLRRNRVLAIEDESGISCILCFFITNDLAPFANKPTWATPKDSPRGHTFFIDKMVARSWNPSLRRLVQSEVEKRYPNITQAYWLREPHNRSVIIKKRKNYVYSEVSG